MSRLEELVAEHCPNGVKYVELGDICEVKTGQAVSKQFIADNAGEYPVLNSGKEPLGYVDRYNTENDEIGVASRGAGVGYVSWTEGKYFRGNLNYGVTVKDPSKLNNRYLYYYMKGNAYKIEALCTFQGIPALNASKLKTLTVPLPPIDVQNEIVRILDTFTELTQELTQERELREKQYDYYRDTLLTFDDDVEMKKLGDVCEIMNGYAFQSKHYDTDGVRVIRISDVQDGYLSSHDEKYYNREMFEDAQLERYLLEHSDIVMSMTGNVGRVAYIKESDSGKIALNQRVAGIKHKLDDVNMRYIYYYLSRNSFMELAQNNSTGGGQKNLGINWIRDYQIPIPSIEVQNEIVEKLDRFNTLANDIDHGLPKEIELRTKQYEYYRDKLLTFSEVTA